MAFIRKCIFIIFLCPLFILDINAQAVYYPHGASRLLKSTAEDAGSLFSRAILNGQLSLQEYTVLPTSGIIFIYDSTITDNQLCKVESNGSTFIKFTAAQDNGLVFGLYQYLDELGYRFYQPGQIWEVTPTLSNPYRPINKSYTNSYKYRNWFISGGHNPWIMDNNNNYGWDTYFGDNGHQWALYQRRNGMTGAYRFSGHRGDIMSGSYFAALQNNPCLVATYNGTRHATTQSVPDINNNDAMDLWGNAILQKFTQYRNTIYGNTTLYADLYHNFNFINQYVGIEVPDSPQWGNSTDTSGCSTLTFPPATNQSIILADHTAQKINTVYPAAHFQLYAYSSHADVPAAGMAINNNIDIQVVSTAFQNETTSKGLLNRWYNRSNNISEYHYLNIPQWGGETPAFYLNELKNTLARLKQKNSQGIIWEASPAKFVSLPFLWSANRNLLGTTPIDSSLREFTTAMFGPASDEVCKLLHQWSDDNTVTTGGFLTDNKYKIPLYLQMLQAALLKAQNGAPIVQQRLRELKAYLHYMALYYDWFFDQRNNAEKAGKAANLCLYLAKINKLQIVNSYFLITDIVSKFSANANFRTLYNAFTGTAYQNGNLPLITNAQIDADYVSDYNNIASTITHYDIKDPSFISGKLENSNIAPSEKINVKVEYTNGMDYSNRCEFSIRAKAAGNFVINYSPRFNMPDKGFINFTVEEFNKPLQVIEDFTIGRSDDGGRLTVSLPYEGTFKLTIISKFKSSVDLAITTNGNLFYKSSPFLGNKTESYRSDLTSFPGFFYVPEGMDKIYFSVHNNYGSRNTFKNARDISEAFNFRDNDGNRIEPQLAGSNDSCLFYLPVPFGHSGTFWQVFKMEEYDLCFVNTSNVQWYAKRKDCIDAPIKVSVIKKNDNCIVHLSTAAHGAGVKWEIYDAGRWIRFSGLSETDLPVNVSSNAIINLYNGQECMSSIRLSDDPAYKSSFGSCASGGAIPQIPEVASVSPNPSDGIFRIIKNNLPVVADELIVLNSRGEKILSAQKSQQFNISAQSSGIYIYKVRIGQQTYSGKLIKL